MASKGKARQVELSQTERVIVEYRQLVDSLVGLHTDAKLSV